MSYVLDKSHLSAVCENYYRRTFRSLWDNFAAWWIKGASSRPAKPFGRLMTAALWICSIGLEITTRCLRRHGGGGTFVTRYFSVAHLQQNIEQQKLLRGGKNADPVVIAKAAVDGRTVVTMEQIKPNSGRNPYICRFFNVGCFTLEEFMEAENFAIL